MMFKSGFMGIRYEVNIATIPFVIARTAACLSSETDNSSKLCKTVFVLNLSVASRATSFGEIPR